MSRKRQTLEEIIESDVDELREREKAKKEELAEIPERTSAV
jgi:hypothetical protein